MQKEILNTLSDLTKTTMEAAKSLGDINNKVVEKAIEQQLAAAGLCMESALKQVKLAQDVKDARDFFTTQTALVTEVAGQFQEMAKSNVALAQEAGAEYKDWLEKGLSQADTTAKNIAKKAAA